MFQKPFIKPKNPCFGAGPVRKPNGWDISLINTEILGHSHRSEIGVSRIQDVVDATRDALHIPKDYYVALVVGSATAAMESALWNLVGAFDIRVLDFDTFSKRWANDILKELKPSCAVKVDVTPFRSIPELIDTNSKEDLLFCYNGSTSGVLMPSLDWLSSKREGLVMCDATSAAYSVPLPFKKLDVTAFSYQKGLGSEAGLGCLVLSPKAYARLQTYTPNWPIPRILRLKDGDNAVFSAKLLNTPSLLVLEEILFCHSIYNAESAYKTSRDNQNVFKTCLNQSTLFQHVLKDEALQSCCLGVFSIIDPAFLKLNEGDQRKVLSQMTSLLKQENVAYDFINHSEQPPSLRIWLGPTMDKSDIEKLFPWLEWAYQYHSYYHEEVKRTGDPL
ncbi:MAG: aminotransferase class V-fold PLP-dependent enzyme [Proteobacteria bacterium]|nr:aminotransferase class V-fold PLP-dependent enzyme [Pseudomonadota bacterium]